MKLAAITTRNEKDFVIFTNCLKYSLRGMIAFLFAKYPDAFHWKCFARLPILRTPNPTLMPKMFVDSDWEKQK